MDEKQGRLISLSPIYITQSQRGKNMAKRERHLKKRGINREFAASGRCFFRYTLAPKYNLFLIRRNKCKISVCPLPKRSKPHGLTYKKDL